MRFSWQLFFLHVIKIHACLTLRHVDRVKFLQNLLNKVSEENSWFSTANRLHYTFYSSRVRFLGTRTNFIRARNTSRLGPNTGKILVWPTGEARSFTRQNLSVPNHFLRYAYHFYPRRTKHFHGGQLTSSFHFCQMRVNNMQQ